jgi:hypothetical protein
MPRPFVEVSFPGEGTRVTCEYVRIRRAENRHELLTIQTTHRDSFAARYRSGTPVLARIFAERTRPLVVFEGYVHRPEIDSLDNPVVTAIGASYILSTSRENRSWQSTSFDRIARDVCWARRLRYVSSTDPVFVGNHRVTINDSRWSSLVSLASSKFLSLVPSGTTVASLSLNRVKETGARSAPILTPKDVSLSGPVGEFSDKNRIPSDFQSFTISRGGRKGVRVPWRRGGDLRDQHRPVSVATTTIKPSSSGLREVAKDLEGLKNSHTYRLIARTAVPIRVGPTDPVCFSGFGTRVDGIWSVRSVERTADSEDGLSTVVVVTRRESYDSGYRPDSPGYESPRSELSPSRLVGNLWVAERSD